MNKIAVSIAETAFRAQRHAERYCGEVVTAHSRPIAWFGDMPAYENSGLRIVTVGLNPSQIEFPSANPEKRFPAGSGATGATPEYIDSLNRYFATDPYIAWFNTFRTLLEGIDASFDGKHGRNTAIHTDLFSPVATSPTWSRLAKSTRATLAEPGVPLWHDLIRHLRPHVVLLSVAKEYLSWIGFDPIGPSWPVFHTIEQRKQPYKVLSQRYDIDGHTLRVVWGKAANTPFGSISNVARRELGVRVRTSLEGG